MENTSSFCSTFSIYSLRQERTREGESHSQQERISTYRRATTKGKEDAVESGRKKERKGEGIREKEELKNRYRLGKEETAAKIGARDKR